MTNIKCLMTSCEYYHKGKKKCFADEIEVNDLAECLTYVTENKCDHILGTLPFYNRYTNDSADTLIFQSDIENEDSDIKKEDIEEKFDFCPKCGKKTWR